MSLSSDYYLISSSEKPKNLVVLLHGYGADAKNLLFLAEFWKKHCPNTVFVAPNAPHPMSDTSGYMWFEVGDLSPRYLDVGIKRIRPQILSFVQKIQAAYSISSNRTIISGFSQGAMLALAIGLLGPPVCAGILSFSGGLYTGGKSFKSINTKVCLVHGTQDLVVSKNMSELAQNRLLKAGISVECHLLDHLAHQINIDGAQIGGSFIRKIFL
jgi:phospholipase/carboxylesterase